jgi:hypothetical protein
MKALLTTILFLILSSTLFAEQNYSVDIYNVQRYNRSIPAISLALTPKKTHGIKFIFSYMSTLFQFEKPSREYALNDKYSNLQISLNFKIGGK